VQEAAECFSHEPESLPGKRKWKLQRNPTEVTSIATLRFPFLDNHSNIGDPLEKA